jgi:hypothetical protein
MDFTIPYTLESCVFFMNTSFGESKNGERPQGVEIDGVRRVESFYC